MGLSLRYFFQVRNKRLHGAVAEDNYFDQANGTFTVQYPKERIPVPDHGRYQLHNEIDDCIVCDKCAKICPVDCIDIEPVRSPETFGNTSDGTPLRIHAAKFDIDMAKCCFCGLCTVVCPTECLTMTNEYDFSTTDILDHNFSFSKMTDHEVAEKKKELEEYQAAKTQTKTNLAEVGAEPDVEMPQIKPKPVFRPKVKPVVKSSGDVAKKPVIKPKIESKATDQEETTKKKSSSKPVIKPIIKAEHKSPEETAKKKTSVKPIIKPKIPKKK